MIHTRHNSEVQAQQIHQFQRVHPSRPVEAPAPAQQAGPSDAMFVGSAEPRTARTHMHHFGGQHAFLGAPQGRFGSAYQWAGRLGQQEGHHRGGPRRPEGATPIEEGPAPQPQPPVPANPEAPAPVDGNPPQAPVAGNPEAPDPQPQPQPQPPVPVNPEAPAPVGATPGAPEAPPTTLPDGPLQQGLQALTISGDNIPAELQQYARIENGQLIIDAGGNQIPPLLIERNDVSIQNARISAEGQPNLLISGANNVTISNSEITGGTTGIKADHASNLTITNNWVHDMNFQQRFDTTAIELDNVSGAVVQGNRITNDEAHPFRSDAFSMFESQDLRVSNNTISVIIDEPSSAPLMVEGSSARNIEVSNNNITYSGPANVPPGLLGGINISGSNNTVNGDTSKGAWQLYAYNDVWQNIFFDGEQVA